MSDDYYFVWLLSTSHLPQLILAIVFAGFLVGLITRFHFD